MSSTSPSTGAAASVPHNLAALEAALKRDLELIDYPKRQWTIGRTHADGSPILDVLIVGGGQGGNSVAFGLLREKVANILVVDDNPEDLPGPWKNFARMNTLRTPKYVNGPDHGIPSLTFRAWYETQFGSAAWEQLKLIPKELWADYINWYRRILDIPTRANTRAGAIEWDAANACFAVPVSATNDASQSDNPADHVVYARKVVLATGIDGSGRWEIPEQVAKNLPKSLYAHTREDIAFAALAGKRVGVLGAGASAFDNASVALETGTAQVDLFFRRKELVAVNPYRWAEFVGFLKHHADLPDAQKWQFILQILRMGQLPPADTLARAQSTGRFAMHAGCAWNTVAEKNGKVHVSTDTGEFEFDYLIIGTGFVTDLSLRPELAKLHRHIALWSDRYTPPEADASADLSRYPYLGPGFEHQEKTAGAAPYIRGLFNYTFGGLASLGFGGASISGMKYSVQKIVAGITRQLFLDDAPAYLQSLKDYDVREF